MFGEALFRKEDLSDYLRRQDAAIEPYVVKSFQVTDSSKTDEFITNRILGQSIVSLLQVDFENPTKDVQEIRLVMPDLFGGRTEIDGVRATRAFAFSGDRNLFGLRPSRWGNYPRGEVRHNAVVIGAEGRVSDGDVLKRQMDSEEATLREYVANSNTQIESHNEALKGKILDAVKRRREQLSKIESLKSLL